MWELDAEEGSLLPKAPGRPFLIFPPFLGMTSNCVFLHWYPLTSSGPLHEHTPLAGVSVGQRKDLGNRKKKKRVGAR